MKINPRLRTKILLLATISMFSISVLQATGENAQTGTGSVSFAPVGEKSSKPSTQMTIIGLPRSRAISSAPSQPVQWSSNDSCYIPKWLEEQSELLRSILVANNAIDLTEFQSHASKNCAKEMFLYRLNILKQLKGK